MKHLIDFFLKTGQVKRMKQRGFVLRGMKDVTSVGAHSFREALMGWVLSRAGNTGLDSGRIMKIVLLHDLCAGYAGDFTPYEPLLKNKNGNNIKKVFIKWVRLPKKEKEAFYRQKQRKEQKTLENLVKNLPAVLANEMRNLWKEYEGGVTAEGRFVQQIDMLENFLQALEHWKRDKKFPIESWWHQMKELINDPVLLRLLAEIDEKIYRPETKKS